MSMMQKGLNIRLRLRSVYWSPTGKSVRRTGDRGRLTMGKARLSCVLCGLSPGQNPCDLGLREGCVPQNSKASGTQGSNQVKELHTY